MPRDSGNKHINKLLSKPPDSSSLYKFNYLQNLEFKRRRIEKVYCVDKTPLSCNFPVFFYGMHNGGGPLFIDNIFSKKEFIDEHSDCKSALEMCSGPGFIGFYLYKNLNLDYINFVDINDDVRKLINKTIKHNNVQGSFTVSDAFDNYRGEKVDLIVLNPPFFTKDEEFEEHKNIVGLTENIFINQSKLITLDKNFNFHSKLIKQFENILSDKGRIVFLEVIKNIPPEKLLENVNSDLMYKINYFKIQSEINNYYTLTFYK